MKLIHHFKRFKLEIIVLTSFLGFSLLIRGYNWLSYELSHQPSLITGVIPDLPDSIEQISLKPIEAFELAEEQKRDSAYKASMRLKKKERERLSLQNFFPASQNDSLESQDDEALLEKKVASKQKYPTSTQNRTSSKKRPKVTKDTSSSISSEPERQASIGFHTHIVKEEVDEKEDPFADFYQDSTKLPHQVAPSVEAYKVHVAPQEAIAGESIILTLLENIPIKDAAIAKGAELVGECIFSDGRLFIEISAAPVGNRLKNVSLEIWESSARGISIASQTAYLPPQENLSQEAKQSGKQLIGDMIDNVSYDLPVGGGLIRAGKRLLSSKNSTQDYQIEGVNYCELPSMELYLRKKP